MVTNMTGYTCCILFVLVGITFHSAQNDRVDPAYGDDLIEDLGIAEMQKSKAQPAPVPHRGRNSFAFRIGLFIMILAKLLRITSREAQDYCPKLFSAAGTLATYPFESEKFDPGTEVVFSCQNGYYFKRLQTEVGSTCEEYPYGKLVCETQGTRTKISFDADHQRLNCTGPQWNAPTPSCIAFTCPVPTVLNGKWNTNRSQIRHLEAITITCNPGYFALGPHSVKCSMKQVDKNDGWNLEPPSCKAFTCPVPPVLNGRWNTNRSQIRHLEVITITCNPGYFALGPHSIKCSMQQADKNDGWNLEPPTCKEIKCAQSKRPERGIILYKNSTNRNGVGAEIEISCVRDFQLDGSEKRKCMTNGRWSGNDATCQPTRAKDRSDCPVPVTPYGGRKSGNSYNKGNVVTYKCYTAFISRGPNRIKCNDKGHWEPAGLPRCEALFSFDDPELLARNFGQLFDKINKTDEYPDTDIGRALDLTTPGGCDITFLLDSSNSITQREFSETIKFIKLFAEKAGVSKRINGTRLAAFSFADNPEKDFNATQGFHTFPPKTVQEVKCLLDNLTYSSGSTNIRGALAQFKHNMLPLNRQARKLARQYLFLFSDGDYNLGGNPNDLASQLRAENEVEIFSVKIGSGKDVSKERINRKVLISISSEDDLNEYGNTDPHYFHLKDYSSFNFLIQQLINGSIDYSECGVAGKTGITLGNIIGGNLAKPRAWPWMVAIMGATANKVRFREHKHLCGGTLLDNEWILTAAHCFRGRYNDPLRIMVKLGANNITQFPNTYLGVHEMRVRSIHIHEKWSKKVGNWAHDIALLRLVKEATFSESVRPICLIPENTTEDEIKDKVAVVTGWGKTASRVDRRKLDRLRQVRLPVVTPGEDPRRCKIDNPAEKFICTGSEKFVADACTGDSGGPLMIELGAENNKPRWYQIGIVSNGVGCADTTFGRYTDIREYRDWIKGIKRDAGN